MITYCHERSTSLPTHLGYRYEWNSEVEKRLEWYIPTKLINAT